jgi:uncharacterized phage protein (TIGR02218 family)
MTAKAVIQGTGLAVDNSEALGALTSDAVTDADIEAGRYDGAEVRLWHVNWADPSERELRFRGTLGEIRREGATFPRRAARPDRGAEPPHRPPLRRDCSPALGDARCPLRPTRSRIPQLPAGPRTAALPHSQPGPPSTPGWFEHGAFPS